MTKGYYFVQNFENIINQGYKIKKSVKSFIRKQKIKQERSKNEFKNRKSKKNTLKNIPQKIAKISTLIIETP